MLERIAARRVELAEHVERLGEELAEARAELERLAAAEQVVAQLIAEDERQAVQAVPVSGPSAASRRIPLRSQVEGASVLPASYRVLWEAVTTAEGPVSCADVCRSAGVGEEKNQVEGARSKLKKLVERGWLRRSGAGMFQRT